MNRVSHPLAGMIALGLAVGAPVQSATRPRESVDPAVASASSFYTIIDLGTLGGSSSIAIGLNRLGQIVGGADDGNGLRRPFLWEDGVMIDLGVLPGDLIGEAWDVNSSGQVVGLTTVSGAPSAVHHGFLWEDGVMIDLGSFGGTTDAHAINDAGQVVGISLLSPSRQHAFLWQDGVMTDLGTLGGAHSNALDINELGSVVGFSFTSGEPGGAFLWQDGIMTNLGTLGGGGSDGCALNDLTQVVGLAARTDGSVSAFLWQNNEMTDLGALGGFSSSVARGINDSGEIVGAPSFLYDPTNGLRDLHDLIPPNSGWSGLSARDIGDNGWIVGDGFAPGGGLHAFVMIPPPPPPIPTLSGYGVGAIGALLGVAGILVLARAGRRTEE